jgi:hypothetical protein
MMKIGHPGYSGQSPSASPLSLHKTLPSFSLENTFFLVFFNIYYI